MICKLNSKSLLAVTTAALTGLSASAMTIVSDTFTGNTVNNADVAGTTPETNLPGTTWGGGEGANHVSMLITTGATGFGDALPAIYGRAQNSASISIASAGGYVKPTELTIQADLAPGAGINLGGSGGGMTGDASGARGVALGFYDAEGTGGQFSQNNFTGLVLDLNGNLGLVQDLNNTGFLGAGSTSGTAVAYVGTWVNTDLYTISYDVDTTTGGISNISVEGSTADYSALETASAGLFTDANTTFAGVYTSSTSNNGNFGSVDNFSVSGVPEPSSLALLGLGGLLIARRRRG